METHDRGIGKRNEGDGSFFSGRKFVIKIKNRNPAPEMATDRVEELETHFCKQCDKVFSSGKALGGHMSSAHVQAGKDYSGKNVKSKTGEKRGLDYHECGVCGKEFPSQKSLYGHMRCHRERDRKGMDPPGKRRHSSETSMEDSANFVVDSFSTLKKWSVKGRRGRPRIVRSKSAQDSEEDNDDLLSRQQLVRLLRWDSNEEEVGDQGCSLRSCVVGTKKKKRKWEDDRCCPYHPMKRQRVDRKEEEESESDTESDIIVGAICFLANAKYITPSASAAALDVREIKHICNICNKVFPTHQALGGHKSSHTKVKVSILNTEDVGKNQICSKWFPTGGHMKIHSNKGCIGKDTGWGQMDFDLTMAHWMRINGAC